MQQTDNTVQINLHSMTCESWKQAFSKTKTISGFPVKMDVVWAQVKVILLKTSPKTKTVCNVFSVISCITKTASLSEIYTINVVQNKI